MRRFPRPHRDEGRGLPPHRGGGKIDGEGTPNYNRGGGGGGGGGGGSSRRLAEMTQNIQDNRTLLVDGK